MFSGLELSISRWWTSISWTILVLDFKCGDMILSNNLWRISICFEQMNIDFCRQECGEGNDCRHHNYLQNNVFIIISIYISFVFVICALWYVREVYIWCDCVYESLRKSVWVKEGYASIKGGKYYIQPTIYTRTWQCFSLTLSSSLCVRSVCLCVSDAQLCVIGNTVWSVDFQNFLLRQMPLIKLYFHCCSIFLL